MEEIKKILSIDFDYFQVADKEVFGFYPDGIDLPTQVSTFVWGTHYAANEDILKTVLPDNPKLTEIKDILGRQSYYTPIQIRQSHKHIYDFIIKQYPNCKEKLHIVNIDMHHDCFNNNPKLDCGNWIKHIKEYYEKCQVDWIANKVSVEVYGIQDLPIQYDFSKIKDMKFDLIYLCRSDNWLPPHLDESFDDLRIFCMSQFYNVTCEACIETIRNIDPVIQELKEKMPQVYRTKQ